MIDTKINGREIANSILSKLKKKNVKPHLVIILVGDNPLWKAYVSQKQKKAGEIGAKTTIEYLSPDISQTKLLATIQRLNNNNNVHGIIVQRPLPSRIDKETISLAIDPKKDIDGFHPESKFKMPLATAALRILREIFTRLHLNKGVTLTKWLKSKKIVVIGKGETGGGPVLRRLKELGIRPEVIDSKTKNPQQITKTADIIISAVGKANIITADMIQKGVILISVGLYKGPDGKLHGDYNEEEIVDKTLFYTPTPGGVGPVNIACLLENLVRAANLKSQEQKSQEQN